MAAVSQKIQNLTGGVSEQPDSLKLPGQLRTCTNFYPDPTFGLSKRPGVMGVKALTNTFADGSWFTLIRDEEEKYMCQVDRAGQGIRVWDADSGVEQTVNAIASGDLDYLAHNLEDDISVLQINDLTFVLNRTKVVRPKSGTVPSQAPWAFAVVNTVAYQATYRIRLNSTDFTFTTPSTVTSGTQPQLSALDIINGLTSAINGNADWNATAVGRYIYIKRANNADFTIEASGGQTGNAIESYKGTVPTVAELPINFINGVKIRVLPDPQSDGDDYWVEFNTEDGSSQGAGIWEETVAPGAVLGIDPTTMPHALIREADGTFTFRSLDETSAGSATTTTTVAGVVTQVSVTTNTKGRYAVGQTFAAYGGTGINLRLRVTGIDSDGRVTSVSPSRGGRGYVTSDVVKSLEGDTFTVDTVASVTQTVDNIALRFWEDRKVGDDDTNPMPTFVDQRLSGMGFFKNRLVLLSGENVICSEAGSYFNFFASTMITFIDSDPIDISCGSLRPIELRHSLATPNGLVLFADNAQYILQTTTDAFSASTAEVNLISSYSQSPRIAPIDMGPTLVFVEQSRKSALVYEMLVTAQGLERGKPLIAELSRTVPSFVPSDIRQLKGTSSASTFAILSRRDPKALYMFRFFDAGNERRLASWFKWTLPGEVVTCDFDHDMLYVVLELNGSNGQRVLGHVNLLTESPGGAVRYEDTFIDVRLDIYDYDPLMTYDAASDTTRVAFKEGFHDLSASAEIMILDDNEPGIRIVGPIEEDNTLPVGEQFFVRVAGDLTSSRVALGYQYVAEALMPAFYVDSDGRKDTLNVPMVNRIMLDSSNSGPFLVTVSNVGRNPFTLELPQIFANQSNANTLPIVRNAQNRIPVLARGDATEVLMSCPFPLPVSFTSMTWEGTFNNRGLRSL